MPSRAQTHRLDEATRSPGGWGGVRDAPVFNARGTGASRTPPQPPDHGGGRPLPWQSSSTNDAQTAPPPGARRDGAKPTTAGVAAVKSIPRRDLCRSAVGAPKRTEPIPARPGPPHSKWRDRTHLPEWQVGSRCDDRTRLPEWQSSGGPRRADERPDALKGPEVLSPGAAAGGPGRRDGAKPTETGVDAKTSVPRHGLRRPAIGGSKRTGPIPARVEPAPGAVGRGRRPVGAGPVRASGRRPQRFLSVTPIPPPSISRKEVSRSGSVVIASM